MWMLKQFGISANNPPVNIFLFPNIAKICPYVIRIRIKWLSEPGLSGRYLRISKRICGAWCLSMHTLIDWQHETRWYMIVRQYRGHLCMASLTRDCLIALCGNLRFWVLQAEIYVIFCFDEHAVILQLLCTVVYILRYIILTKSCLMIAWQHRCNCIIKL